MFLHHPKMLPHIPQKYVLSPVQPYLWGQNSWQWGRQWSWQLVAKLFVSFSSDKRALLVHRKFNSLHRGSDKFISITISIEAQWLIYNLVFPLVCFPHINHLLVGPCDLWFFHLPWQRACSAAPDRLSDRFSFDVLNSFPLCAVNCKGPSPDAKRRLSSGLPDLAVINWANVESCDLI